MQQQLLQLVIGQFGLQIVEQRSPLVPPQSRPINADRLLARLEGSTDFIFPDTNERTRAEMIVAPILLHLAITYGLSLYSGTDFNADIKSGLSGTVDHLLSRANPQRSAIAPPITAVVETKSRERGVSHCLVQMVAAQRVNACPDAVYGVVTNGLLWQFLKLEGATVTVDLNQYPRRVSDLADCIHELPAGKRYLYQLFSLIEAGDLTVTNPQGKIFHFGQVGSDLPLHWSFTILIPTIAFWRSVRWVFVKPVWMVGGMGK